MRDWGGQRGWEGGREGGLGYERIYSKYALIPQTSSSAGTQLAAEAEATEHTH